MSSGPDPGSSHAHTQLNPRKGNFANQSISGINGHARPCNEQKRGGAQVAVNAELLLLKQYEGAASEHKKEPHGSVPHGDAPDDRDAEGSQERNLWHSLQMPLKTDHEEQQKAHDQLLAEAENRIAEDYKQKLRQRMAAYKQKQSEKKDTLIATLKRKLASQSAEIDTLVNAQKVRAGLLAPGQTETVMSEGSDPPDLDENFASSGYNLRSSKRPRVSSLRPASVKPISREDRTLVLQQPARADERDIENEQTETLRVQAEGITNEGHEETTSVDEYKVMVEAEDEHINFDKKQDHGLKDDEDNIEGNEDDSDDDFQSACSEIFHDSVSDSVRTELRSSTFTISPGRPTNYPEISDDSVSGSTRTQARKFPYPVSLGRPNNYPKPERFPRCIHCYINHLTCDANRTCIQCDRSNRTCKRAMCKNYKEGTCQNPKCQRAHEGDERKFSHVVHAGPISQKKIKDGHVNGNNSRKGQAGGHGGEGKRVRKRIKAKKVKNAYQAYKTSQVNAQV